MRAQDDAAEFVMQISCPSGESPPEDILVGTEEKIDFGELFVQEPEAEDEADGWEILNKSTDAGKARCRSIICDGISDNFMRGCLDEECDAYFVEGSDKYSCDVCRLTFCEKHVVPWQLVGVSKTRSASGDSSFNDDSPRGCGSSTLSNSAVQILELLRVPMEGSAFLCRECRTVFTPSRHDSDGEIRRSSAVSSPTNVVDVATEAEHLFGVSLAKLKSIDNTEDPNKSVARALLLRLLERLRTCLRPWVEQERAWVASFQENLVEDDPTWISQFARQVRCDNTDDAKGLVSILEKSHRKLPPRDALQVLASLGRHSLAFAQAVGDHKLGVAVTLIVEAMTPLEGGELACCLELLLDAAEAVGLVGAPGGRRAILNLLLKKATGDDESATSLRGEFFWALEARVGEATETGAWTSIAPAVSRPTLPSVRTVSPRERVDGGQSWVRMALEELLHCQSDEVELGLLRQRSWVRHLERGDSDAAKVPCWGPERAFPMAVWHPSRRCLGLRGHPRHVSSANAPTIVGCACLDVTMKPEIALGGTYSEAVDVAASGVTKHLLLKRETAMHMEQQVGQTLRCMERLIWEDDVMKVLLQREGLASDDVRVTYVIAMTGPSTAMVEFIEDAATLRDIRAGKAMPSRAAKYVSTAQRVSILEFLRHHNKDNRQDEHFTRRLAFTAAVSAVLSFIAGLGDRHHENFMVTTAGRLLHVDYGYALGREPLDSVLIHLVTTKSWARPVTTLQYEELSDAVGNELLKRIFWPVVHRAYLIVRENSGLMLEMFYAARMRLPENLARRHDVMAKQEAWNKAQHFVAERCAEGLSKPCAERFIHTLLWHCARHEAGSQWRDRLKNQKSHLGVKTQEAVGKAYDGLVAGGRRATSTAKGAAFGLFSGVRGLLAEATRGDSEN